VYSYGLYLDWSSSSTRTLIQTVTWKEAFVASGRFLVGVDPQPGGKGMFVLDGDEPDEADGIDPEDISGRRIPLISSRANWVGLLCATSEFLAFKSPRVPHLSFPIFWACASFLPLTTSSQAFSSEAAQPGSPSPS
jgi:hypothetical protein